MRGLQSPLFLYSSLYIKFRKREIPCLSLYMCIDDSNIPPRYIFRLYFMPTYRVLGIMMSKVRYAFFSNYALPPFSPPLPSVVQFPELNRHWTFDIRNTSTPVLALALFSLSFLSDWGPHTSCHHIYFSPRPHVFCKCWGAWNWLSVMHLNVLNQIPIGNPVVFLHKMGWDSAKGAS